MKRLRCAIYTRKSTQEGLEQDFNSLDAQREACAAFIAGQAGEGWQALPARYDDGGFSGGTLERPALQRLIQDIESGGIQVVVTYKVDLAGLTASDASADIKGQTQQILDTNDGYLAAAGTAKSKLLQANLWITDVANFSAMNESWSAWVDPDNPPVRACVQAGLARHGLLVEIMVTAMK